MKKENFNDKINYMLYNMIYVCFPSNRPSYINSFVNLNKKK